MSSRSFSNKGSSQSSSHSSPEPDELWFYRWVARRLPLGYSSKIMVVAFLGTHVPLLALIVHLALRSGSFLESLPLLGVALAATLGGTGATLFLLYHLLRPVSITSRGMRNYMSQRVLPQLPEHHTDEAGTLMADAAQALKSLDAALSDMRYYDALTGLPNRSTLLRRLADLTSHGAPFVTCVLSVGAHGKLVTTVGQAAGDALLVDFADRLRQRLSGAGSFPLALIDGHRFAFTLPLGAPGSAVAGRLRELVQVLSAAVQIGGMTLLPQLRLGAARFPQDAQDPETLVNRAVNALANDDGSREPGAEEPKFFSETQHQLGFHRLELEHQLGQAIERDEFELYFQPLIDLRAGRLVGAEALIRWNHPQRGLLLPGHFIGLAEQTGLIDPLGRWVMAAACRQLQQWQAGELARLSLAVNLSARQLQQRGLVREIEQALSAHGLPAARLEVEVTETLAMGDIGVTESSLAALRELGVRVAIDDFGSGFSSLSQLQRLPFDKLKIDRAFVSGIDRSRKSEAICRAIIELAHGMDAEVLAEGVETDSEVRCLSALGCGLFQGYFFGRPMPAQELERLAATPGWAQTLGGFDVLIRGQAWGAGVPPEGRLTIR